MSSSISRNISKGDLAVSVRGLGKSYTIRHDERRESTLAETALARLKNPLRRPSTETFWALKDVSFDIAKGEVVGIIGRNGAGKSTLLKVLSRITEPTTGAVDLYGRVGSLLEVGTGFHPELTGRENVYLNGAILGMTRPEIRREFDAIVDFAGVERFLDTPVKRYSSGMYVRLAFAVAAHLSSEVLIVDEVLAVGDAEFQKKCLGKMRDVADGGRTVLLVSHQLPLIELLCDSAVVLRNGEATKYGNAPAAIQTYLIAGNTSSVGQRSSRQAIDRRPGSGEYRFTSVKPASPTFRTDEVKIIDFAYEQYRPSAMRPFIIVEFLNDWNEIIARCDSRLLGYHIESKASAGRLAMTSPWLKPGSYRVSITIDSGQGFVDVIEDACRVDVTGQMPYKMGVSGDAWKTANVLSDFDIAPAQLPCSLQAYDRRF